MLTVREALEVPEELRCYYRRPRRASRKDENPWSWEDSWARKRAEELRKLGYNPRLVRQKGEPLCVIYKVQDLKEIPGLGSA